MLEIGKHRWIIAAMIIASSISALFEVGAISILGLAVAVLTAEIDIVELVGRYVRDTSLIEPLRTQNLQMLFISLICLAIGVQVLKSTIVFIAGLLGFNLVRVVATAVTRKLVETNMTARYEEVAEDSPGYVFSLAQQVADNTSDIVVGVLKEGMTSLLMLGAFLSAMLFINAGLAAFSMALLLGMSLVLRSVVKGTRTLARRTNEQSLAIGAIVVEYLGASRLLRIFDRTSWASDMIISRYSEIYRNMRQAALLKSVINPTIDILTIGGLGAMLIVGSIVFQPDSGTFLPELFVFLLLIYKSVQHSRTLTNLQVLLGNVRSRCDKFGNYFSAKTPRKIELKAKRQLEFKSSIVFDKVSYAYPGSKTRAVNNISFSIEKGQTVALVGPSGAGKTTVLDLLIGLYQPTSGSIVVDGRELSCSEKSDKRLPIGVVDQEIDLFNASIRDNIIIGRPECDTDAVKEAAKAAYADQFIMNLAEGYDTVIGPQGYSLSGGQRQRLAIARALVADPEILIFDEATSSLDSKSESLIQETLRKVHHSRTVLLVAHRLATIKHADNIVVIADGNIVEMGDFSELIARHGIFAEMWAAQR